MHIPKQYRNEDSKSILSFLHDNTFGTLISVGEKFPMATHTIFEIVEQGNDKFYLRGHISKANPQTKKILTNPNVLCVFQGPHTYISSSWYSIPEVPTWNYISIQIEGKLTIIDDEKIVYEHLDNIVKQHEATTSTHLDLARLPHQTVHGQMKGLVAFDIEIINIDAAKKLSQNRSEKDFANIIQELKQLNRTDSLAIAQEMEQTKCPYPH